MVNYTVIKDCDEEFRIWKVPRERTVGVSPRRVCMRLSLPSRLAEGIILRSARECRVKAQGLFEPDEGRNLRNLSGTADIFPSHVLS